MHCVSVVVLILSISFVFHTQKRWWKFNCWENCYTITLCTALWILWEGKHLAQWYPLAGDRSLLRIQNLFLLPIFYLVLMMLQLACHLIYELQDWDMVSFIRSVKAMVWSSNSVAVITFPSTVLSNSFCKRWQHLADTLLSIKAIPGKLDPFL